MKSNVHRPGSSTLLLAVMAAPAAAQYRPVVVTPGQVSAGGAVTVTGQACMSNEVVQVYLVPGEAPASETTTPKATPESGKAAPGRAIADTRGGVLVATVTADKDGNWTATFNVPAGTAVGTYHVAASCGTLVQSANIEVVPDSTTVPGGGGNGSSGGGSTADTGANIDRLGLIGAGLLVAGGLLLVATKRRRHDTAGTPAL